MTVMIVMMMMLIMIMMMMTMYKGTSTNDDDDNDDIYLMTCLFEHIKGGRSNIDDERLQLWGT